MDERGENLPEGVAQLRTFEVGGYFLLGLPHLLPEGRVGFGLGDLALVEGG